MKKLLLVTTALYLFIAPLTYHPDNKLVLKWSGVESGSVWNIWSYGAKHFGKNEQFNYPPVHFYLDKLQYFIAKPLAGSGFDSWLQSSNATDAYTPHLARFTFAIKSPLILAALLVGVLIFKIALQKGFSREQALLAAGFWYLNPITLYSVPMMGQNDVLAILFFLLGWYLLYIPKKDSYAAVLFGCAASIKMYPFIWLLFLLTADGEMSLKKKIQVFSKSLAVFFITLLPFITNSTFRNAVLFSSTNGRFTLSQLDIGFSDSVSVVLILLSVLLYFIPKKYVEKSTFTLQANSILTSSLILLGFSHFHVQWYLWTIPFLAFSLISVPTISRLLQKFMLIFFALGSWLVVLILFADTALTTGMFIPLGAHVTLLPVIRDTLLSHGIDALQLNMYAHTVLASVACLSLASVIQSESETKKEIAVVDSLKSMLPRLRLPKIVIFFIIQAFFLLIVGVTTTLINFIPAPRSDGPPQTVNFHLTAFPLSKTVTATRNGLYFTELQFKNLNFTDAGAYVFSIATNGKTFYSLDFSGKNLGDPDAIRFTFPVQAESQGTEYTITIAQRDPNYETTVETGFDTKTGELATQLFYRAPSTLSEVLSETRAVIQNVVKDTWAVYLVASVLLFLAL